MMGQSMFRIMLLTGTLLTSVALLPGSSHAQSGTVTTTTGWTFSYEVSGNFDGLSLKNVQFGNLPLMKKVSLPVMRVFYQNNACGPYADRLGGTLSTIPWANNATVAQREFTLDGRQWYEIGIRDQIGSYDIYQVYYLSNDGILDAHIYSKGLQCVVDHVHYPNWRFDLDIQDPGNDQILRSNGTTYDTKLTEFNAPATDAVNHGWRVQDSVTGSYVDVLPGFTNFTIPNQTTQPVSDYTQNTVFGRFYKATEDGGWTFGPNTQVPFNEGESINNTDLVFWYEGSLPHSAAEGSALWHSTGVRLVVTAGTIPPPPPPTGTTQTFTNTAAITIPDSGKGTPYPSTISVSGMSGNTSKVVVKLNGLTHTYPDDLDFLLVGPGGQRIMLMSDAGGSADVANVNLTFDSASSTTLPNSSLIVSGTYAPSNYDTTTDAFSAPAPVGPYGTSLGVLNGTSPNGTWQLFLRDDYAQDRGSLAGGWQLTITTN